METLSINIGCYSGQALSKYMVDTFRLCQKISCLILGCHYRYRQITPMMYVGDSKGFVPDWIISISCMPILLIKVWNFSV